MDRDMYWHNRAKEYAYMLWRLVADGDGEVEDMFGNMEKDGFVDSDGEWEYE